MKERTFIDSPTLSHHLSMLMSDGEVKNGCFEIFKRSFAEQSSTFITEIVTGRFGSNDTVTLFCKYFAGIDQAGYEHHGGVEYEAKIYKDVIRHLQLSTVRYYGCFNHFENSEICMVLEYLTDSKRLKWKQMSDEKVKAAAWIANLHSLCENRPMPGVKVYDKNYYSQWVDLALDKNPDIIRYYPWFSEVCNCFLEQINDLITAPQTFIHGEYYPGNILIRDGIIYPIDWESAAIGPGEIDLASLIDYQEDSLARSIIDCYTSTRWKKGDFSSEEFVKKLLLAQIYFNLCWIAQLSKPVFWIENPVRLNHLYQLGKQAGFLS